MPAGLYIRTPEIKMKMSLAHKEQKPSLEMRKRISESLIGNTRCIGRIPWNKGKTGLGGYKWKKSSITPEHLRIRGSIKYRLWRLSVFERDQFTCQSCGQKGGKLNVDHIRPFAHYPELRFDMNNGRTLCVSCHRQTDTYGGKTRPLRQPQTVP